MLRKFIVPLVSAAACFPMSLAAQTVKVGLINSYTGFVAQVADQGQKGTDLYLPISISSSTRKSCRPASKSSS